MKKDDEPLFSATQHLLKASNYFITTASGVIFLASGTCAQPMSRPTSPGTSTI
jgi:hypothetical protein